MEWVGVRKISPQPGFDPRTVQPVAIRYTDWAIPALHLVSNIVTFIRSYIQNFFMSEHQKFVKSCQITSTLLPICKLQFDNRQISFIKFYTDVVFIKVSRYITISVNVWRR